MPLHMSISLCLGCFGFESSPARGHHSCRQAQCTLCLCTSLLAAYEVPIEFCSPSVGMTRNVVVLDFVLGSRKFNIGRYVEVRCGDAVALRELAPTSPYQRRKRQVAPPPREIEVIAPPSKPKAAKEERRALVDEIKPYWIDRRFQEKLQANEAIEELEQGNAGLTLLAETALKHYRRHMERLLWAEEFQLVKDLHEFDLVQNEATMLQ